MKTFNADLQRYFRSIRSWLPCGAKQKQQIMDQVKENVLAFCEEHPEADLDAVQAQFGSPQQIAAAYVDDMDTPALLTALRLRKRIVTAVIAGLSVAMILWGAAVCTAMIEQRDINYGHTENQITEHNGEVGV